MIQNFIKIAFRGFSRRKGYTAINIFGLASGMAVCLLILLYIKRESTYDNFQEKKADVYRLVVDRRYPSRTTSYAIIPQSYAAAVKKDFPEVKQSVRVFDFLGGGNLLIRIGERRFEEKNYLLADSNFFAVFSAVFLAGDPLQPLEKPNSVVLNETTARKYFGDPAKAVGQMLEPEGNDQPPLLVTAVVKDWPENSHFRFNLLQSTTGRAFLFETNYVNFACFTYLLLQPGTIPGKLESKMPALIKQYASGDIEKHFAQPFSQFQAQGNGYHYYLQPLEKIHLTSQLENEFEPNGSEKALQIFSLVAFFILALACVNFINLSTARSVERAREVGIRKTFGSEKKELVVQFLVESVLMSLTAMFMAVLIIIALLPFFNQITGQHFKISEMVSPFYCLVLLAMAMVTGLAAGLYPAFVLSSFQPILVLKGKFKSSRKGLVLRNALVVFQFSISVMLIVCTIVVRTQMDFMTSNNLGFTKEQVLLIDRSDRLENSSAAFKNALEEMAAVQSVTGTSAVPGQPNYFGVSWLTLGSKQPMTGRGIVTDDNYQKALGLELKEGRYFSRSFPTDTLSLVLNERAVAELGLTDPIGKQLISPDANFNAPDGTTLRYTVIGVLKDFHFQSMHRQITPLVFVYAGRRNNFFVMAVRLKAGDPRKAITAIQEKWNALVPGYPFHYDFLDKTVARQYQSETTLLKIFSFFSLMAILIACLGLLGLIAYAITQKRREISIRKVLGASVSNIAQLLSKDFIKLVLLASFIAFPIAWFVMYNWLQDFVYRIPLNGWIFLFALFIAIGITLLTISFQAIKAGMANPVKTLRTE